MKREIITTSDGSTTIYLPDWQESYHSKHGAVQEAYHVFIKNGLGLFDKKELAILEIGFGTGLNCLITLLESKKTNQNIDYVGIEAYPISSDEVLAMNYTTVLEGENDKIYFQKIHQCNWEERVAITPNFRLTKRKLFFDAIDEIEQFDLIYFDAFGFRVQPELWSLAIFQKMFKALKNNGILVTYAARGVIKRNMIEAGFSVEKLPGPPGKREMTRGFKNQ